MKTRWYFIIACGALASFAVVYQDFYRADARQRAGQAQGEKRTREDELARRHADRRAADDAARSRLEELARQRAMAQAQLAREQEARDAVRAELATVRDEIAAQEASRHRLIREVADEAARVARVQAEHASLAHEIEFLDRYLAQARANVERVSATVNQVDQLRVAMTAAANAAAARTSRDR